jgi:hypothetical protein
VPFGRSFPCGTEFIFLGAVIGKYTFRSADGSDESSPRGLCTIVSEGRAVRYVEDPPVGPGAGVAHADGGR